MCECTPKSVLRYCGQPGCRDPRTVEQERINAEAERDAQNRNEQQQRQQRGDFEDAPQ